MPPGGTLDTFARGLAGQLAPVLGQQLRVENVVGAGGLLAVKAAARAAPDGYTLVLIQSGLMWVQAINPKLDLLRELVPVARLAHSPLVLIVRAESPSATLVELIAAVRARPGRMSFASGGLGSPSHVAVAEMANRLPGFDVIHVPYNGAAESAVALMRGDVDFEVGVLGAVLPLTRSGRLRALAVTGANRLALLPDVPTLTEAVLPGLVIEPWGGLAMPAHSPPDAVARLGAVFPRALEALALSTLMDQLGLVADYAEASVFALQIARELPPAQERARRLGLVPRS